MTAPHPKVEINGPLDTEYLRQALERAGQNVDVIKCDVENLTGAAPAPGLIG